MDEALVILAEECGELTQACCKILRFGAGDKEMKNLVEEMGDVLCLMTLLMGHYGVSEDAVLTRVLVKEGKLARNSNVLKNNS